MAKIGETFDFLADSGVSGDAKNQEGDFWIMFFQLEKLIQENKRLKLLAHDLQKEIEVKVLESQETHELEEK